MIHVDIFSHRYLNTTYIKKQKYTDADLSYGGISTDTADQLLEIGEVSRSKKVQKGNKGLQVYERLQVNERSQKSGHEA